MANFCRADHQPIEIANACNYLHDQGKTQEEIAKMLGRSISWVQQHLKLLKLLPGVLKMMAPDVPEETRLGFSTALLIADVPRGEQQALADKIVLEAMSLNTARNFVRGSAAAKGFQLGTRMRRPHEDFDVLKSFSKRLVKDLEAFIQMPPAAYATMFASRNPADRAEMTARLGQATGKLQKLQKLVAREK